MQLAISDAHPGLKAALAPGVGRGGERLVATAPTAQPRLAQVIDAIALILTVGLIAWAALLLPVSRRARSGASRLSPRRPPAW